MIILEGIRTCVMMPFLEWRVRDLDELRGQGPRVLNAGFGESKKEGMKVDCLKIFHAREKITDSVKPLLSNAAFGERLLVLVQQHTRLTIERSSSTVTCISPSPEHHRTTRRTPQQSTMARMNFHTPKLYHT